MASQGQQNTLNGSAAPSFPSAPMSSAASTPQQEERSPLAAPNPKLVAFELVFPEAPDYRARLPMRVQIYPHDTTDSIITTVKNFYGLYEGPGGAKGVSFEDAHGNTLIARYENFQDAMIVYVRVVLEPTSAYGTTPYASASASPPSHGHAHHREDGTLLSPHPQPAQALTYGQPPSRPTSRTTAKRSASPHLGRGRRSASASAGQPPSKKAGPRSVVKSRGSSSHEGTQERNGDGANACSDSDGGPVSTSGSRKGKTEQVASAEISLDNIVEGGRRKRAKFESSVSSLTSFPERLQLPQTGCARKIQPLMHCPIQELPLFVPTQVPVAASSTSTSPPGALARQNGPPLFHETPQHTFAYPAPPHSPRSLGPGATGYGHGVHSGPGQAMPAGSQHGHHLRNRPQAPPLASRHSTGAPPAGHPSGILPTPDPTIASCISDEDVAIQLMRLGDASNLSLGTRNSASTVDDGLSGVAEVASSAGDTSDEESDGAERPTLPAQPRHEPESSPIPLPGSIKRRHKHLDEILPSFDSTEPSGDEGSRKKGPGDHDREDHDDDEDGKADVPSRADHQGAVADKFLDELEAVVAPTKGKRATSTSTSGAKSRGANSSVKSGRINRSRPAQIKAKPKAAVAAAASAVKTPMSPASLPPHSRKASTTSTINFQHNLREDEEDLSSKPRCQRCRKSKKGCDRQRPCQRCKDAGIGVDGCISEDEMNGRKGRFGRHMGVAVKKGSTVPLPVAPAAAGPPHPAGAVEGTATVEKGKKRKR